VFTYSDDVFQITFPYPVDVISASNSWLMNAKDVRVIDCANALLERWRRLSTDNTISNFFSATIARDEDFKAWFYRGDLWALQEMKALTAEICGSYYHITNAATGEGKAWDAESVCFTVDAPTNFLSYTPYRGTDTQTGYERYYSNTWTLPKGGTNIYTTSAGTIWTNIGGTTGDVITVYSTNTNIEAGRNASDYGFDAFRRVITNMSAVVTTVSWTNNGEVGSQYGRASTGLFWQITDWLPAGTNMQIEASNKLISSPTNEAAATASPHELTGITWDTYDYVTNYIYAVHSIVKSYARTIVPANAASVKFYVQTYNGDNIYDPYNIAPETNNNWRFLETVESPTQGVLTTTATFPNSFSPPLLPWEVSFSLSGDNAGRGWITKAAKAIVEIDFEYK
jgi:hypothetical protein